MKDWTTKKIKDIEGLNRCNPKDVEYVDLSCWDSVFVPDVN